MTISEAFAKPMVIAINRHGAWQSPNGICAIPAGGDRHIFPSILDNDEVEYYGYFKGLSQIMFANRLA